MWFYLNICLLLRPSLCKIAILNIKHDAIIFSIMTVKFLMFNIKTSMNDIKLIFYPNKTTQWQVHLNLPLPTYLCTQGCQNFKRMDW